MHFILVGKLLILLAVANGTPVVMKKILRNQMAWPVDGGLMFVDGRPLLGPSKTIRGLLFSISLTMLVSGWIGLGFGFGAGLGAASMAGDLFSSFVKRRLNFKSSSRALGLDQIPESAIPLALASLTVPLTILDIFGATVVFFAGALLLSRLFFRLKLRDQPY